MSYRANRLHSASQRRSSAFSEQRDWCTEGWSDLPKATQESHGTASDTFSFEFCSSTLSVTSTHPSSLKWVTFSWMSLQLPEALPQWDYRAFFMGLHLSISAVWPFYITFALQRMLSSCSYHLLSAAVQRRLLSRHRAKISSHRPCKYIQTSN